MVGTTRPFSESTRSSGPTRRRSPSSSRGRLDVVLLAELGREDGCPSGRGLTWKVAPSRSWGKGWGPAAVFSTVSGSTLAFTRPEPRHTSDVNGALSKHRSPCRLFPVEKEPFGTPLRPELPFDR